MEPVIKLVTSIPTWVFLAVILHLTVLGSVAYMILLERKVASWAQDRIGPNRVGFDFGLPFLPKFHFWGLGQPLADGLKFIAKEDYRPSGVDKILFTIAPLLMIIVIIPSIATVPWGGWHQKTAQVEITGGVQRSEAEIRQAVADQLPASAVLVDMPRRAEIRESISRDYTYNVTYKYPFQIADLNIGVLFILATLSLAVYGIVVGGWASNNKFSFLGGLRATANMISYEIPMALSVLTVVILFGTLNLDEIVQKQTHLWWGFFPAWNVFTQPLAFVLFLIAIHAEANRAPFDLAEAEQELVGGYHTEYSAMRFALFFLGEYAGMITTSCVLVALFFGGWHIPFLTDGHVESASPTVTNSLLLCILRAAILFGKAIVVMFVFMWVRWSLPRFRFDQLMTIAWKGMIPITLLLVIGTVVVVWITGGRTFNVVDPMAAVYLLVMNAVALVAMVVLYKTWPAGPNYNKPTTIAGSRFNRTPLPGMKVIRPSFAQHPHGDTGPRRRRDERERRVLSTAETRRREAARRPA